MPRNKISPLSAIFGRQLRQVRKAARLSQEELCLRAEVGKNHIGELERGAGLPSLGMLFRICDALNVPASSLVASVEREMRK